ncbi:hypothetical protein V5O48_011857 [Marasmius crinis-equi]|uniref:Uncharacterized protein n=1 Tax=Marasmius crinis-equi TaxID=585013 RepID=A0ABR3F4L6_9AGAR
MTIFFPAGERICTAKEFQPNAINFPSYPEWDLDTVLNFARRIIVVPTCDVYGHYPCEPEVFRVEGAVKPHRWCFYITEGVSEVPGEGIYPDDPLAHSKMPEMPYYEGSSKVALYTDDERLGNVAWVVGPFDTIDNAKHAWHKRCLKEHSRRWDGAHAEGRSKVAAELKQRAYTVKSMLVVKAIAEVCPAIATQEIPSSITFGNTEGNIFPDPFTVMKAHADTPSLVGMRPLIEPLSQTLWAVTSSGATAFDSIRLAYYHAANMSKKGLRLVVVVTQQKGDAVAVFKEMMGRVDDKANDEALAHLASHI